MAAYLLVAIIYIALRIYVFSTGTTTEFDDSSTFLEKALVPLHVMYFFDEHRPFVLPLLYKITILSFGHRIPPLAMMQVGVSIAAWLVFAWSFARVLSGAGLGFAGFVAALVMSLSLDITMWDRIILSESITISLFVLFLAAWMQVGKGLTYPAAAGLFVVPILFSGAREANSLVLLPFAVVLMAWAWLFLRDRRRQIVCAALAASWILIAVGATAISQRGERWLFPLLNVIGTRVLTDPERLGVYRRAGMPVNERLRAMKGEMASGQDWAFYYDPKLAEFLRWTRANGRAMFSRDLTSNPGRTLKEPMADLERMVCPVLHPYNIRPATIAVLPDFGQSLFCWPSSTRVYLFGSLIGGSIMLVLALVTPRRFTPEVAFKLLTLAAMLLGWPPFLWFTWQVIGGMEVERHSLAGTFEFRLAMLFVGGYLAMAIRQRSLPAPTREAEAGGAIDTSAGLTAH